jgi:hypothetical protein
MHFNAVVLVAISLLSPLASAGCYTGGITGNKQLALDSIHTICGAMQGSFRSGQVRTGCITDPASGNEWFFSVKCISGADRTLPIGECEDGLAKEVNGCSRGGDTAYTNWEYRFVSTSHCRPSRLLLTFRLANGGRSDPNEGVCMDNNFINNHPPRQAGIQNGDVTIRFGVPVPPEPESDAGQKRALRYAA